MTSLKHVLLPELLAHLSIREREESRPMLSKVVAVTMSTPIINSITRLSY